MKHLPSKLNRSQGVTLVEVMVVIAIVAIVATFAVPSYQDMIERNRLKQAAESLADDLKFARTEAIKRSADSSLALSLSGSDWSYTVSNGGVLKTVQGSDFQGISLNAAVTVTFSFRRGLPNAAIRPVLSSTHYQSAVDLTGSGRVTICTPAGETGLPGYPTCP